MIVDCTDCEMYQSQHCEDCFVMAVLNRRNDSPLEIDDAHRLAIDRLQRAGLAPALRFTKKAV